MKTGDNRPSFKTAIEILEQARRMFNFGRFTGEEDFTLQKMKKEFLALGGEAKDFPTFLHH